MNEVVWDIFSILSQNTGYVVFAEGDIIITGSAAMRFVMKLSAAKFGVAFGIIYAVVFFVWGLAAALFGWGAGMIKLIAEFYPGFGSTPGGAAIGALWGFGVGFVFFSLAAAIYNRLIGEDE
jgi:hypothetical protein